jgi:hypothetical protein
MEVAIISGPDIANPIILTPRQRIASVPYALSAAAVETDIQPPPLDGSTFIAGTVSTDALADQSATSSSVKEGEIKASDVQEMGLQGALFIPAAMVYVKNGDVCANGASCTIANARNVASVVNGGNGKYTINYATPFLNTNYLIGCMTDSVLGILKANKRNADNTEIIVIDGNGHSIDTRFSCVVFGN